MPACYNMIADTWYMSAAELVQTTPQHRHVAQPDVTDPLGTSALPLRRASTPPKERVMSTPTPLNLATQQYFLGLDQGVKVQAEYVWIGGNNELRCKTKARIAGMSSSRGYMSF